MFELVPPKGKLIDYESPYLKGVTFKLKVFDFSEDDEYTGILLRNCKEIEGNLIVDNENYYIEIFNLGVSDVIGLDIKPDKEGKVKFQPTVKVFKTVVNKIIEINNPSSLEK